MLWKSILLTATGLAGLAVAQSPKSPKKSKPSEPETSEPAEAPRPIARPGATEKELIVRPLPNRCSSYPGEGPWPVTVTMTGTDLDNTTGIAIIVTGNGIGMSPAHPDIGLVGFAKLGLDGTHPTPQALFRCNSTTQILEAKLGDGNWAGPLIMSTVTGNNGQRDSGIVFKYNGPGTVVDAGSSGGGSSSERSGADASSDGLNIKPPGSVLAPYSHEDRKTKRPIDGVFLGVNGSTLWSFNQSNTQLNYMTAMIVPNGTQPLRGARVGFLQVNGGPPPRETGGDHGGGD